MPRHLIRAMNASSAMKPETANGPGSNGYWRREIFRRVGTTTWTASKDGKVKIQAIGAASGGRGRMPGPSGGFGEKTLDVKAGQTLTIVIAVGTNGREAGGNVGQAATTSISGAPVGATPLLILGAALGVSGTGTTGEPTGPWDVGYRGATALGEGTGSPSSASPFGAGLRPSGGGGAGWGGIPLNGAGGGGSTHGDSTGFSGASGSQTSADMGTGSSQMPQATPMGTHKTREFWDLSQVDSSGGSRINVGNTSSASYAGQDAGPGAGGAGGLNETSVPPGKSALGGGTGAIDNGVRTDGNIKSGAGAGGCCAGSNANDSFAGKGGDAIVFLFWDEVA